MNYVLMTRYLEYCRFYKKLSKHSLRAYESDLRHFLCSEQNDVTEYIAQLTQHVKKTSTLKRKVASLKSFYKYLEDEQLLSENPLKGFQLRCRSERQLPKTISHKDLERLFHGLQQDTQQAKTPYAKHQSERNLLIFSLLLATGLRISELCQLTKSQIDLSRRLICIKGKGRKERILYIGNDTVYNLLESYLITHSFGSSDYIFPGKNNTSYLSEQSIRLILKRLSLQLQLQKIITPHMFRHSFATMLLDQNVDIRHIQHLLGHSSIAVTQIYTHVSQAKQEEILRKYNPLNQIL